MKISVEFTPRQNVDESLLEAFKRADYVNVTDNPGSRTKASPLAFSIFLKQRGLEPIMQMTCRDRNAAALKSDLLGAKFFGIKNFLALTGDHPAVGDGGKAVFELDSTRLLKMIKQEMPDAYAGAAINPYGEWWIEKLRAGKKNADFYQTQPVMSEGAWQNILELGELRKKTFVGIIALPTLAGLPGIGAADERFKRDPLAYALEICSRAKAEGFLGVHAMARSKEDYAELLNAI